MPADLSSPRLGDRSFDLLDDLSNQGLRKRIFGEVDMFQFDDTHELYAHMNINYIKLDRLPAFDRWGDASSRSRAATSSRRRARCSCRVSISRVDGERSRRVSGRAMDVSASVRRDCLERRQDDAPRDDSARRTREFGKRTFEWRAPAAGWQWARVAVWDVAGNGAFVNPDVEANDSRDSEPHAGDRTSIWCA